MLERAHPTHTTIAHCTTVRVSARHRRATFDEPEYTWSGYNLYYGLTPKAALDPADVPTPETLTLLYGELNYLCGGIFDRLHTTLTLLLQSGA